MSKHLNAVVIIALIVTNVSTLIALGLAQEARPKVIERPVAVTNPDLISGKELALVNPRGDRYFHVYWQDRTSLDQSAPSGEAVMELQTGQLKPSRIRLTTSETDGTGISLSCSPRDSAQVHIAVLSDGAMIGVMGQGSELGLFVNLETHEIERVVNKKKEVLLKWD
jgi:hypothetical protein